MAARGSAAHERNGSRRTTPHYLSEMSRFYRHIAATLNADR